jgi:hypothetical protein
MKQVAHETIVVDRQDSDHCSHPVAFHAPGRQGGDSGGVDATPLISPMSRRLRLFHVTRCVFPTFVQR